MCKGLILLGDAQQLSWANNTKIDWASDNDDKPLPRQTQSCGRTMEKTMFRPLKPASLPAPPGGDDFFEEFGHLM